MVTKLDTVNRVFKGIQTDTWQPKRKPTTTAGPKGRQSKLAKEHNISAQEEGEIKEAWGLFAEPMDGEKNGVLPIDDVKSALMYVWYLVACRIARLFTNTPVQGSGKLTGWQSSRRTAFSGGTTRIHIDS